MGEEIKIEVDPEIQKALKELEEKLKEEEQQKIMKEEKSSELPRMVQLVIKYSGGLIKEQKQAEYVLLVAVALMFALSLYFFFRGGGNGSSPSPLHIQDAGQSQLVL